MALDPGGEMGAFEVEYDGKLLHSRLETGKHPEFDQIRAIITEWLDSSSSGEHEDVQRK